MTPRPTTPADIAPVHLTPPPGGPGPSTGAGAAAEFDTLWQRAGAAVAAETGEDGGADDGAADARDAAPDEGAADEPATTSALADGFAELWALAGEVRTDLASAGPESAGEEAGAGARKTAPDDSATTPAESICQPHPSHLPQPSQPPADPDAEAEAAPEPPHETSPESVSGADPSRTNEPQAEADSATGTQAEAVKGPQPEGSSAATIGTPTADVAPAPSPGTAAEVASSGGEEPQAAV
ncbi:MAG: hypothetical protein FWE75_23935, partial [Actinomycetia bacterium]|nr:hypothetical protein [Actinomycetes bacterium]